MAVTLKIRDAPDPDEHPSREGASPSCTPACVQRRVPITQWLPRYQLADIAPDFIAGFTVGLTLIPQSMAYAGLAGLEPQYGLYSSFLGTFVYIVFGTVKEINLGPAALTSLLTFNYTHKLGPQFAVLLCFLCGCFELLCGLLHLGFLVEFISTPVVSGFTSAAAITIASAQVKGLLGLSFKSESFLETWSMVASHVTETRLWDAVLGFSCIAFLLTIKALKDWKLGGSSPSRRQLLLSAALRHLSNASNAMVVLASAHLASVLVATGNDPPFRLTGQVAAGLPSVQLPEFTPQLGNQTLSFLDSAVLLAPGTAVTSLVAIIGNIALGKAFAQGGMLDATQEMVTLGLCNIAGSLVGSMPVTGSFSRSAISRASGVRSPMAGLYAGVMVLLSISLLTPYFYFIPKATLAAVIVCAVCSMADFRIVTKLWSTNKRDAVSLVFTFTACLLLGMEIGLLVGVSIDVAGLLYSNARPRLRTELMTDEDGVEYLRATPSLGLLFPATDHVRSGLLAATVRGRPLPVVLDCAHVTRMDYTAAQGMKSLVVELSDRGRELVLLHARPRVLRLLEAVWAPLELHQAGDEAELSSLLREMSKGCRMLESSAL